MLAKSAKSQLEKQRLPTNGNKDSQQNVNRASNVAHGDCREATVEPKLTPGRAALLGLIKRYLVALMDDSVTLLELHKLMYFMQEAGEPLKLEFVKGKYGPYATNLRHVLNAIEGHFLTGFGDASEEPGKPIEPLPGAIEKAEKYLQDPSRGTTMARFHQVEKLMEGFETAYGLELLGSVHWVAKHEPTLPATLMRQPNWFIYGMNESVIRFPGTILKWPGINYSIPAG